MKKLEFCRVKSDRVYYIVRTKKGVRPDLSDSKYVSGFAAEGYQGNLRRWGGENRDGAAQLSRLGALAERDARPGSTIIKVTVRSKVFKVVRS